MHRVMFSLNSSKASKSQKPDVITLLAQEHSPCPVKLMWDYAKIRLCITGLFFLKAENLPPQYSNLASIITIPRVTTIDFQAPHTENWRCNTVAPLWVKTMGHSANEKMVIRGISEIHLLIVIPFLAVCNRLWFIGTDNSD